VNQNGDDLELKFAAGGQVEKNTSNIGNLENLKTDDKSNLANSINELKSAEVYSTDEVKTNKIWIDDKPIYRKVINFGTLPNAADKFVDPNIIDLERIITMRGLAYNVEDGNAFPLPNVTTSGSQYTIDIAIINKQIRIRTAIDRTSMTAYVILEYTKTTD